MAFNYIVKSLIAVSLILILLPPENKALIKATSEENVSTSTETGSSEVTETTDTSTKLPENTTTDVSTSKTESSEVTTSETPSESTTTEKLITTTRIPETTTTSTTTTKPTTTTVTTETTSTTTESTTTTQSTTTTSTIKPHPTSHEYNIRDKDNNICLHAEVNTVVEIPYMKKDKSEAKSVFDLSKKVPSVTGKCGEDNELIEFGFGPEDNFTLTYTIKTLPNNILAKLNNESDKYAVTRIDLQYYLSPVAFPDTAKTGKAELAITGKFFESEKGSYYSCKSLETIGLKPTGKTIDVPQVNLVIKNNKFEAFRTGKEDKFVGKEQVCSNDSKSSSAVPIAVGVTLAVMILIALIVFLVGSRRRQNNYETL